MSRPIGTFVEFATLFRWTNLTQRADRQRKFLKGNVWKTVLCLKHFRPTWTSSPSRKGGLGLSIGLDPVPRIKYENYRQLLGRTKKFTSEFGTASA